MTPFADRNVFADRDLRRERLVAVPVPRVEYASFLNHAMASDRDVLSAPQRYGSPDIDIGAYVFEMACQPSRVQIVPERAQAPAAPIGNEVGSGSAYSSQQGLDCIDHRFRYFLNRSMP